MELKTDKSLERRIIKTGLKIVKAGALGTGVYFLAKYGYYVNDIQACTAGAAMGALAYILNNSK